MKKELLNLTVEELEYLMGKLNQPALMELERGVKTPPITTTINQLEGPDVIGGSGADLKSAIELDFETYRKQGLQYFLEHRNKMETVICNNESIKKHILENDETDIDWLIDKLVEAFFKDVDLKKSALVLAVYLAKIGIKSLCK